MKKVKFLSILAICLLSLFIFIGSRYRKISCEITYLGNCGFLFKSDNKKVLIDALGTEYGDYFKLPSVQIKSKIIEGKEPFNDIDLMLVTHRHGDHFNVLLTEQFLLNNPESKMICPRQVYQQLKDSSKNFTKIKEQILSPNIKLDELEDIKSAGLSIKVFRMQHGAMRSLEGVDYSEYSEYEKTENFGYLFNIGNKNIFHQGDACLRVNKKTLSKITPPLDIAYLSFFDWDKTSFGILKESLKAENVIFMHGTVKGDELNKEEFKEVSSKIICFKNELDSKLFE